MTCDDPDARTYFLTLRLADRRSDLLVRRIDDLRRAMRETLVQHPLHIDAIAVLPAVIHLLWTLPPGDCNLAARIGMLKCGFSRAISPPPTHSLARIRRRDKGIWQRHHWVHALRDGADFNRHRNLIYHCPVHADLCAHPRDWPHTSLHRDLMDGAPPPPPAIAWPRDPVFFIEPSHPTTAR
tara:strand:+ start:1911 stop:2456 length:546 start_codon:yes stop_codon:yes gene_type:complete